jgi:hypothetical protein
VLLPCRWEPKTNCRFCYARSGASPKQPESFLLNATGQERGCPCKKTFEYFHSFNSKLTNQIL